MNRLSVEAWSVARSMAERPFPLTLPSPLGEGIPDPGLTMNPLSLREVQGNKS